MESKTIRDIRSNNLNWDTCEWMFGPDTFFLVVHSLEASNNLSMDTFSKLTKVDLGTGTEAAYILKALVMAFVLQKKTHKKEVRGNDDGAC